MKYLSNLSFKVILLAILLTSCGNKETPIHPTFERISSSVYASGIVKSRYQYDVYSKTNGLLTAILVKEGELVTKGQAILKLANQAQALSYENAQLLANYSSGESNQEKIRQAENENGK